MHTMAKVARRYDRDPPRPYPVNRFVSVVTRFGTALSHKSYAFKIRIVYPVAWNKTCSQGANKRGGAEPGSRRAALSKRGDNKNAGEA